MENKTPQQEQVTEPESKARFLGRTKLAHGGVVFSVILLLSAFCAWLSVKLGF